MIVHVEIPAANLERAIEFYRAVFDLAAGPIIDLHGHRMAYLTTPQEQGGASCALCEGEIYVPASNGAVIYIGVADVAATLARATARGSETLFPRTMLDDGSFVAEIADSEGNRIAFQGG